MDRTDLPVVGAGPSGLAAAIAATTAGRPARVFERRDQVGGRFHGDFQGLENWTTEGDVLEELGAAGITATFEHTPFRELTMFDGDGRATMCRSDRPIWYLVRRGTDAGTLDQALAAQARAAGVTIETGNEVRSLPGGGIVAHGPRRADAIAVGYVFETDAANAAYAAVSDTLAPAGYAYLLICNGRATVASCMFADFHNERRYLERTVEFFDRHVGVVRHNARRFGGFGNMALAAPLRRGSILFAGEAAGMQDALFGFGMRYAMMSGHLAGLSAARKDFAAYEDACRRRLLPTVRTGFVNRALYARGGERGYRALIRQVARTRDVRAWLRRYYTGKWWSALAYPLALADVRRRQQRTLGQACPDGCDCTWCKCRHDHRSPGESAP
ncbi:MAG: NAD(P)-binding protein [Gemmatimonadota bacterium]|nr:NAD(P)-binding protein [Gemmatimonadota bacterium]